jgi:hypothetical protein
VFTVIIVNKFTDDSNSVTTPGTVRYALATAASDEIIRFDGVTPGVTTIALTSRLVINKSLTIEGNGVTITRDATWTTVDNNSHLMYVYDGSHSTTITVSISRVCLKGGRITVWGGALTNEGENLTLESCIFIDNQTIANPSYGGAIHNCTGTLAVKGCTFYGNKSTNGGAIDNNQGVSTLKGTVTLTGNLFYENTANNGPAVNNRGGTVTSSGYNVVDKALGTGTAQSGFSPGTGDKADKFINSLPVSPVSFRPLFGGGATDVITSRPDDYPVTDFYGSELTANVSAGAVWDTAREGHLFELTVNDSARGNAAVDPQPDADGIIAADTVKLTAAPAAGYGLSHWLVKRTKEQRKQRKPAIR